MRATVLIPLLCILGFWGGWKYFPHQPDPPIAAVTASPATEVKPAPAKDPDPVIAPEPEKPEPPKPATPAEPAPDPPALTNYQGRTIAQTMHWTGAPWLQRREREEEENGGLMRKQLEVQPGQTVCDLGSGDGYHTLWMASVVGETGKVYAVDIQKEMLDMLQKRAEGRGYKNIISALGTPWDPKLPPASQDLILMVDVYHEFSHPEHMLKAIRTALKPEGRMVLVEFRSEDDHVPIKPEHKMSKAQILKEILPMGFKLAKDFDELPWQHFMSFARDEAAPAGK